MVLRKIAVARGAVQLPPRATTGMAIRPQVVQSPPAAIVTLGVGTKVPRGIYRPGAAVRRGHRLGWRRRRLGGMGGFALTQGARRSLGQASKRLGFLGALASGGLGWHERLVRASGNVGPQPAEHQEDAHQRHETELVEHERRYHGNVPAEDGVRETL